LLSGIITCIAREQEPSECMADDDIDYKDEEFDPKGA